MTIILDIANPFIDLLDSSQIEQSVQVTLKHQMAPIDSDLTVLICDDSQVHVLNQQYLGVDAPTDVLAFPGGFIDPDTQHIYLGDVIISYPQAKRQADRVEHSLDDEIRLLVVHGILHLLGHDHHEPEKKALMWSAQAEILSHLNANITMPE
jgi:probable rRNA maturation factor